MQPRLTDFRNVLANRRIAPTTVTQHRLGVFRPAKKVKKNSLENVEVSNAWGTCFLPACRLTQVHACVIEAIFSCAIDRRLDQTGALGIAVRYPDVLRALGRSPSDTRELAHLIDDLRNQDMLSVMHDGRVRDSALHKIVREVTVSERMSSRPADVRHRGSLIPPLVHWIVFHPCYAQFYLKDHCVDWSKHLKLIYQMNGCSQAIARYTLSQGGGVKGESIAAILGRLGVGHFLNIVMETGGQKRINAKRRSRDITEVLKDMESLAQLGIQINNKAVWYSAKEGATVVRHKPIVADIGMLDPLPITGETESV